MKKILLLFIALDLISISFFSQESRIKEKFRQAEEYRNKNLQDKKTGPGYVQSGAYSVSPVPYTPYPYAGTTVLNGTDDLWANAIPIGFNFCYFGATYNQVVIGSNGELTFNLSQAGQYDGWQVTTPLPSTTDMPANTIAVAFRDIDASQGGNLYYNIFGSAPNRALVVSWVNIPLFSSTCSSGNPNSTFQVALHEGSSVIDVYIQNSTSCSGWNGGYGEIGLLDSTGTVAVVPPGRNYPATWTAVNEAWEFVPTAGACAAPCGSQLDSLCYVNVNSNLQNEIYFNHVADTGGSSGTIIYRLNSSAWDSVGFVPYSQTDMFTDPTATPGSQKYTYSIARVDSCNHVGGKSPAHTSIFLQGTNSTGNQIDLTWNAYAGMPVAHYYVMRGTSPASYTVIAQVPDTVLSYSDPNPPAGTNFYKIAVTAGSCSSNAPGHTIVSSNYISFATTAINSSNNLQSLRVYPNPSNGQVTVSFGTMMDEIKVTDVLGNTVYEAKQKTNEAKLNLMNAGLYFVTVTSGKHTITRKLVVN